MGHTARARGPFYSLDFSVRATMEGLKQRSDTGGPSSIGQMGDKRELGCRGDNWAEMTKTPSQAEGGCTGPRGDTQRPTARLGGMSKRLRFQVHVTAGVWSFTFSVNVRRRPLLGA